MNRFIDFRPYRRPMTVAGAATLAKQAYRAAKYGYNVYKNYKGYKKANRPGISKTENAPSAVVSNIKGAMVARKGYKRVYPNRKGYNKPVRKVFKRLKHLEKKVENNTGHCIYKDRQTDSCVSTANHINYNSLSGCSTLIIQSGLAQLRYYNPAVPGTYTTADYSTGTQTKKILYSVFSQICLRNNYKVPCEVDVYLCTAKTDTADTTVTAYTNGIADMSGLGITDVMIYPSEVPLFNMLWRIRGHRKATLAPGGQMSFSSGKLFMNKEFDPSLYDEDGLNYERTNGSHQYLIRVTGVVGHDATTTGNVGISAAGVDYKVDTRIDYRYSAGARIYWVATLDNSDAVAAGVNISEPTISQLQYST